MDYFKKLLDLLALERQEDRLSYKTITEQSSVADRRTNGLSWYPVAIKGTEMGRGDYLTIEVERTTHQDIFHQFRSGMPVALFSNHNAKSDRIEGVVSYLNGNTLKISLQTDELEDWAKDGKLGIDLLFDDNSYDEMITALKLAAIKAEKNGEGNLVQILTGSRTPTYATSAHTPLMPG